MERINKGLQLASAERAPTSSRDPAASFAPSAEADARTYDGTAVEYTQTRVLNVAPSLLEGARIVTGRGSDPVTRAYKLLRTRVLQRMSEQDWQTVAVLSPASAEGKTLTAINLAVALATSLHHTTLLVDFDWQRPSVHRYFDYDPEHDVADYLEGRQPFGAVMVNPGIPGFCFIPRKTSASDSSEQLAGAAVREFVAELKNRYRNRLVLFDLPPVLATDDALSFLPLVDCALVVVEEDRTPREDLARTLEVVGEERLLGTVMNKSRQRLARY